MYAKGSSVILDRHYLLLPATRDTCKAFVIGLRQEISSYPSSVAMQGSKDALFFIVSHRLLLDMSA